MRPWSRGKAVEGPGPGPGREGPGRAGQGWWQRRTHQPGGCGPHPAAARGTPTIH